MDENIRVMSESDRYMESFLNNLQDKHAGIGNIYVARTVDKNGKTVDVKFGKNMMTDYGMQQFFITKNNFPNKLYIGYGSTSTGFNHTSQQLVEPYDTTSTLVSETRNYAYPMYFDKVSGLITCVCRALQVKFPLNISGLPDEISITEYGIGTAWNALWTHSWVYDTLGRYGTLIKRPEEELYIDVYYCMSYYEDLILDNWANGRYTVITTLSRFFNRMTGKIVRYRRDNKGCDVTSTTSNTAFQNNQITNYRNISDFTMINTWSGTEATDLTNGYFDGFGDWHSGFSVIEHEKLTTPEPINAVVKPNGHKDDCISNCFGKFNQESLPFTQADIISCKRFNYVTGDWDIVEQFENDPDKWYTETFLQTYLNTPIYYTNNQTILTLYLYQNLKTDDPITAFDLNLETVYAAEKYWDKTTWHFLSNIAQVPNNDTNEYNHTMNCQTARYYITNSNAISLIPHRTKPGFVLTPVCGSLYNKTPFSLMDGTYCIRPTTCNPASDSQWFCYGSKIFSFKYNKYYDFGSINNPFTSYMNSEAMHSEGDCMCYGDWIMFKPHYNRAYNTICYMNMSNLSVIPTIIDNRLYVDGNNNISYAAHLFLMSETETGYIALQGRNYNTGYVYNLKGDASVNPTLPTPTQYATKQLCCIWGTERIAYIESADTSHIKIYEFGTTNDVVMTLDIPEGFTPAYMFGHTNYLWLVSNNSSVAAKCYDLLTGTSVNCNVSMSWFCDTNNTYRIRMTAVEECLVIYRADPKYSDGYINAWFYIELSNPAVANNFSAFSELGDCDYGPTYFKLSKLGNTIILLHNERNYYGDGAYVHIYDFGQFLKTNTKYVTKIDYTARGTSPVIAYGDQFICNINEIAPKEYFIPHKLIGTTPTVTSLNNYVNVRNKQFWTTFTNITDYQGLPPGDKQ